MADNRNTNPNRAPQPRPDPNANLPVDRSGTEAVTGRNLSRTDEPTDLAPDNDLRRAETIENRADATSDDPDRDALLDAEREVYGDDKLKQRGSGSRYRDAHPTARAHLAVVEQQVGINEIASLGRSIAAAAERLAAANREVMKATEEARNDAAQPTTG